ncbi:oxygenase MpaB family protein [Nocardia testacea]|uniref:oxygenase MpaB family protein n=1 Tax=Nocardia testacea TaxID=248551 RepID=UPI0002FEF775|nr:oxygenase MpaB family protein [Nocardia testacea]
MADHSEFLSDRWARIIATAAATRRFSDLDGPGTALAEGRRLRELHWTISGVVDRDRRYHALNADAYLWVAATGYWAGSAVRRRHGQELDRVLPPAVRYPLRSRSTPAAGCPHAGDRPRVERARAHGLAVPGRDDRLVTVDDAVGVAKVLSSRGGLRCGFRGLACQL